MDAKCPYFGECGGCSTQHLDYDNQLLNKKNNAMRLLSLDNIEVISAEPYGYRSRIDLHYHGLPGLRRKDRSNRTVQIRHCVICSDRINGLLEEVWQWCEERQQVRGLVYVVIRASRFVECSTVSFVFRGEFSDDAVIEFVATTTADNVVVARTLGQESVSMDCYALKGSIYMEEKLAGRRFCYHSQGFFQNNPLVAESMVEHVDRILTKHDKKAEHLLDLYSGAGVFGISCAQGFKRVTLVESAPSGTECAEINVRQSRMQNITSLALDADHISRLDIKDPIVITDPARSGMSQKALQRMIAMGPKLIVYVSCNPVELSKELRVLKHRYEMESATLFDMFPQTNHMEIVATLKRKDDAG
jgi:23S rRNA (uracil-5-)-methyltransferase RumA